METDIRKNGNLAYWTGVVQTDGYLKIYTERKGKTHFIIRLTVGRKSLPMIHKFQKLSEILLNRKAKIFYYKAGGYEQFEFHIGVAKLLNTFKSLDINFGKPPKPPIWCLSKPKLFGAYLAGVIDGDGNVRYRRPQYPQCIIRISSKNPPYDLEKAIELLLKCSACIVKDKAAHSLEFCVSPKNHYFIKKYLLPNISLTYKKDKILNFLSNGRSSIKAV